MSEPITTRINSSRLGNYNRQTIRIVGKLKDVGQENGGATLEASDGGIVRLQIIPAQVEQIQNSTYVEVIGEVIDPSTVKYQTHSDLGDNVDLKMVDEVIEACFRFHGRIF